METPTRPAPADDPTIARLEFLADASRLLASSLDYETTLRNLAGLAVPTLADWCLVYMRADDGSIERFAMSHGDPTLGEIAGTIRATHRIDPDAPSGVSRVIRAGEPLFHPEADAKLLAGDVEDPEALEALLAPLGITSWLCVPLTARGRTLGAISLVATGRRYTRDDVKLAVGLAERAALAVDNARLYLDLRFQRALLTSQNEATIDGILVVSPDGAMISFNRRFIEMWSIPAAVVESRSDEAAIQSVLDQVVDPGAFVARIEHLYEHPDEESDDEIELKDGRIFDRWSAPLLAEDGSYLGRAWYFRDVTDRRRAELIARDQRARAELLATASSLFASSLNESVILKSLAEIAVQEMADWCFVDVTETDGQLRRVAVGHADPERAELAEQLRDYGPTGRHPALEVMKVGRGELLRTIDDVAWRSFASDDAHLDRLRATGVRSGMVVPLLARGRIIGTITLGRGPTKCAFGEDDLVVAEDLARRASLAVDNARLFAERAHVARVLQESLLPDRLPTLPGVRVATRFHAGGEGTEVGGDFYDLFPTGDDTWSLVVGDVCGRGVVAARLTALARYTLRTAAMDGARPSAMLATLNRAMLAQAPDGQFCTVSYATLRPSDSGLQVTIACGGHPLPFVVTADGTVGTVGEPGTLLGVYPDLRVTDTHSVLAPGDMLIVYTDGVIEARNGGGQPLGEAGLRRLLASCSGLPPESVADRIDEEIDRLTAGSPRDDVAFVILQVEPGERSNG